MIVWLLMAAVSGLAAPLLLPRHRWLATAAMVMLPPLAVGAYNHDITEAGEAIGIAFAGASWAITALVAALVVIRTKRKKTDPGKHEGR